MSDRSSWHNQDAFWEMVEPMLFDQQRQASAPAEVEKIVALLAIDRHARILDLCCGAGRHSLELSRRGFDVVGVDRTARYIEKAKQAALQDRLNVQFVVGDMREYCAPGEFDIVLNLFGSFGYFEDADDDRSVVEHMYASLRPGGKFLIETMGKEILARDFQARDWTEIGDLLVLWERKISQDWRRVNSRWIAIKDNQRLEHRVSVRSYSAVELSALLYECGFAKVRAYGDLEGIDYDHAAKRLVVLGDK